MNGLQPGSELILRTGADPTAPAFFGGPLLTGTMLIAAFAAITLAVALHYLERRWRKGGCSGD